MSYDLYMLEPVPGEDPMETLERLDENEAGASPDPAIVVRNRRIADDLLAANSGYAESQLNYDAIAEQSGITVDEARARNRFIELMDQDGLQVTLSDQQASINFPYWESLDAKTLAAQIATASRVIGDATGWRLYDPQLERFIDPVADADEFAEAFAVGVGHVRRIAADDAASTAADERPSLWQRLFGRR